MSALETEPLPLLRSTVRSAQGLRAEYREYLPCKPLRPYVACYWTSTVDGRPTSPDFTRVLPDACSDIMFDLASPNLAAHLVPVTESAFLATSLGPWDTVAVRFKPCGVLPLLHVSPKEIRGRAVPLPDICGNTSCEFADRLAGARSVAERINTMDAFLLRRVDTALRLDVSVGAAIERLVQSKGRRSIESLFKEIDCGERQLRRKFLEWTGLTPKMLSRTLRFLNAAQAIERRPSPNWAELALQMGFHDQAHFIHDFRDLSGLTPIQFARSLPESSCECPISTIQDPRRLA